MNTSHALLSIKCRLRLCVHKSSSVVTVMTAPRALSSVVFLLAHFFVICLILALQQPWFVVFVGNAAAHSSLTYQQP